MMNGDEQLDDFLKSVLQAGSIENPPSANYTQKVMQKVEAIPVIKAKKHNLWLIIFGLLAFVTVSSFSIYFLVNNWSSILAFGTYLLQKLPFAVSFNTLFLGFIYLFSARILLTICILTISNKSAAKVNLAV